MKFYSKKYFFIILLMLFAVSASMQAGQASAAYRFPVERATFRGWGAVPVEYRSYTVAVVLYNIVGSLSPYSEEYEVLSGAAQDIDFADAVSMRVTKCHLKWQVKETLARKAGVPGLIKWPRLADVVYKESLSEIANRGEPDEHM